MNYLCRTWATIDLDAIVANFDLLKKGLPTTCRAMAVVKADAYGHGDCAVTLALAQAGADWAGVSNLDEAISLRRQGITLPILILGYTPPEAAAQLAEHQITQTVFSPAYAAALSQAAVQEQLILNCHIKLDTGMTRLGFFAQRGEEQRAASAVAAVCRLPGLSCTGVFTHFASADEQTAEADAFTRAQFDCFNKTVELACARGAVFELRHCCNSAAAIRFPEMHLDLVRLGVALYGIEPDVGVSPPAPLRPAMSLYSVVSMVKEVPAGCAVSYGRIYHTPSATQRIATVAVGYADGYRRNLGGKGRVLIGGEYAPVIGRVCMDQMMIDVTKVPGVQPGDRVTLVGKALKKEISFSELAKRNGTIPYEEICLIARRVPRVYIHEGREVAVVDYLRGQIE